MIKCVRCGTGIAEHEREAIVIFHGDSLCREHFREYLKIVEEAQEKYDKSAAALKAIEDREKLLNKSKPDAETLSANSERVTVIKKEAFQV